MRNRVGTSQKSTPRRAHLLYASLFSTVLLTAFATVLASRFVGPTRSTVLAARDTHGVQAAPALVCATPPAGLVAWYPGEGNANDIIGGHNGTPEGGTTFAAGFVGQALSFNGTDADVSIPGAPNLNVGLVNSFTIDLWIKPATVAPTQPLVEWNSGAGDFGVHFWLSVGAGRGNLYANIVDISGGSHILSSPFDLVSTGTFQHVALTYDRTTGIGIIYHNGVAVAQQNLGTFTPLAGYDLYLGLRASGAVDAGARYSGLLDEVGIFTRSLTASEIQAIVAAGASGKCQDGIFTVTNTDNGSVGSLRQAINNANSIPGTQTITFNIPGAGVHTISPTSALPAITDPLVIDGYTQPGAAPATLAVGAVLNIVLDGTSAGQNIDGLTFVGGNSTVRGLVVNRFGTGGFSNGSGITINSSGNTVEGCFIGTDATGTSAAPNAVHGIFVSGGSNNTVGGTNPAARNVISGNGARGIELLNSDTNTIQGNYIGTNKDGTAALANSTGGIGAVSSNNLIGGTSAGARNVISGNNQPGIFIGGSSNQILGNLIGVAADGTSPLGNRRGGISIGVGGNDNVIGDRAAGAGNHIAYNGPVNAIGIGIFADSFNNTIRGNSIHDHPRLGIALTAPDSVTPNDPGDADTGGNNHQNFPELTSATGTPSQTTVQGMLNSTAGTEFTIDFYSNPVCDASGNGEGQTFLGSTNATTDEHGNTTFAAVLLTGTTAGQSVTATATDSAGNTSEFSACLTVAVGPQTFTVTNTNDSGAGSLRQAITDANSTPGVQTITFNIPGTGVRTIAPTSTLPTIADPVVIDGYTQAGAGVNTLAVGNNAVLLIELGGTSAGPGANGLTFSAGGSTLRGLVINRFQGHGVVLDAGDGNVVAGNFIGTTSAGTSAAGNTRGIFIHNGSANNRVGTDGDGVSDPAERNLISGNTSVGIWVENVGSDNNVVAGNYIGTNAAGTAGLRNGGSGIYLHNAPVGTRIGTDGSNDAFNPNERNVIVGSVTLDLFVDDNAIAGNFIGVAADGTTPIPGVESGVTIINFSDGNRVGSNNDGVADNAEANVIANHLSDGVLIAVSVNNRISRNSIYSNGTTVQHLGIELTPPDGVNVNDPGDADAGANNGQNFPVLTSATVVGNGANVGGTLNSTPNANFTVELFANTSCGPTGHGEGQTFLGAVDVTTDAAGHANISAGPFAALSLGQFVTATATNKANGDTSEFSQCVAAARPQQRTVTNTNDDGPGSLRQVLNEIADSGTIDFGPGARGIVTLSQTIVVNKRVNVVGPGANLLTLSGNNLHRILNVLPGAEVNISRLSFSNGNEAGDGGAILNGGRLTLMNCTLSKSDARGRGGAVFNSTGGTFTLDRSTVSANSAGQGGGISNAGATTITASSVSGNFAQEGGGIFNVTGTLNLVNSTVSGNGAVTRGGGVANEVGTLSIRACTVYGNRTNQPGSGGGVSNGAGTSSLGSSIVANNSSGDGLDDLFGTLVSQGFNLVAVVGPGAVLNPPQMEGDRTGTLDQPLDPRLGPLQNNGGPTDTHALLQNSPALDRGANTLSLPTDQRGVPRRFGEAVDVGAFENRGSVSGFVLLRDASNVALANITLTLSGHSATGEQLVRTTQSGPAVGEDGNYTFMDVPEGSYTITPQEPRFTFEPGSIDLGGPGTQAQPFFGALLACPTSSIGGRVVGPDGRGLDGVTLTLSGPKTVVLNTPGAFDCPQSIEPGSFCFGQVPSGTSYTLTPTLAGATFKVVEGSTGGTAADNGRGGADIPDLGGTCVAPDFPQRVDFRTDTAPPTPTPTPSDDFTADTTDPDRFRRGVLSLETDAFEPSVRVVQGNGQLQITPRVNGTTAQNGAAALDKRFNGYVSVRNIDLNSSTSISVRADQPLASDGAQTVFSAGSDLKNFYRIRVADAAETLDPPLSGTKPGGGTSAAAQCTGTVTAGTPAIFFEAFIDGQKYQGPAPDCAVFRKSTDVFWRLRLEPKTETLPAACHGLDARAFVLFETSVDRSTWETRYCAPVGARHPNVASELLAGILGTAPRDPGTAKFSDYRVADRTGIRFDPSNPVEVELGVRDIELKLIRDGDVSSAASVVLHVSGSDVMSSSQTHFFKPGERTANVSFRNPFDDGTEGNRNLTLRLADAVGGALDPLSNSAPLIIRGNIVGSRLNDPVFFTSQQYCDFLNRVPDAEGLTFWTGEIQRCGADAQCREVKRVNVSAAFFLSIEFQRTGYFVYRLYHASFARMPRYDEFLADTRAVGDGVVVGHPHWEDILNANRRDLLVAWVNRPDFKARFDPLNHAPFVDAIYAGAGVPLAPNERTKLVLELLTGQKTRKDVLASLVESDAFVRGHFNRAFVLTQYFGYLQRDPDETGFNHWLGKLDGFDGDFIAAEMVKAFIESDEYKNRFRDGRAPSCFSP